MKFLTVVLLLAIIGLACCDRMNNHNGFFQTPLRVRLHHAELSHDGFFQTPFRLRMGRFGRHHHNEEQHNDQTEASGASAHKEESNDSER